MGRGLRRPHSVNDGDRIRLSGLLPGLLLKDRGNFIMQSCERISAYAVRDCKLDMSVTEHRANIWSSRNVICLDI